MKSAQSTVCSIVTSIVVLVFSLGMNAYAFPPSSGETISGKILETMDASGYTYLQIDDGKSKLWAAIPQSEVKKGEDVTIGAGMVMENFESKTLGRTFPAIVFSPGIVSEKQDNGQATAAPKKDAENDFAAALQAESGSAHANTPAADIPQGSAGSAGAIVPSAEVTVAKAEGDDAYTVGEIYEKRQELSGKTVQVRGKVMKLSPMIMGKNWIHLQDGTGNPMVNSHDLVITTMASPAVDSVVLLEGTVHADRDFGAGYRYDVIIEDAAVK